MAELLPPALENRLVGLLQRCRRDRNTSQAVRLHSYMRQHNLETHAVLGNFLVPLLLDCVGLAPAQLLFDKLPLRSEPSWTSLISAYVESGNPQHALGLYLHMQHDSVSPSGRTFLSLLRACTRLNDTGAGYAFHTDIMGQGLDHDAFVGNTLVDMYGKCGLHAEAQCVFDKLPAQGIVTWNTLIAGYAEHGFGGRALECLQQMQLKGLLPVAVTFPSCLKACAAIGALETGQELHAEVIKRGLEGDLFIANTLVDMYSKCGSLPPASYVFDRLPTRDAVSWNAMMAGFAEQGFAKQALDCFKQMQQEGVSELTVALNYGFKACGIAGALEIGQHLHTEMIKEGWEKDLHIGTTLVDMYAKCGSLAEAQRVSDELSVRDKVSWAALISGYAECGFDEQVLTCLTQMQVQGVPPVALTLTSSLKACSNIGVLENGREMHVDIINRGWEKDLSVANALIDMYGKCGSLEEGRKVFDKQPLRDVVTWTAMIKAYGKYHKVDMATRYFEEMQRQGVKPNDVTFTCLLAACSHASLLLKGQEYFKLMTETYGMRPNLDHCSCMVDLLARSGYVCEAERFAEAMHCLSSKEVLRTLLSACKIHGEVELGFRCFECLLQLNDDEAAPYLLMADIYANAGRWRDVIEIEQMRKNAGAKKKLANVSLEVNKTMYEFVVGDKQSEGLSAFSKTVSPSLRDDGYVPNLDLVFSYKIDEAVHAFVDDFSACSDLCTDDTMSGTYNHNSNKDGSDQSSDTCVDMVMDKG